MSKFDKKRKSPKRISKERFKSKLLEDHEDIQSLSYDQREEIKKALDFEINFIKDSDLSAEEKLRRINDLLPGKEDTSRHLGQLGDSFTLEKSGKEYQFVIFYQKDDEGGIVLSLSPEPNFDGEDSKNKSEEAMDLLNKALSNK